MVANQIDTEQRTTPNPEADRRTADALRLVREQGTLTEDGVVVANAQSQQTQNPRQRFSQTSIDGMGRENFDGNIYEEVTRLSREQSEREAVSQVLVRQNEARVQEHAAHHTNENSTLVNSSRLMNQAIELERVEAKLKETEEPGFWASIRHGALAALEINEQIAKKVAQKGLELAKETNHFLEDLPVVGHAYAAVRDVSKWVGEHVLLPAGKFVADITGLSKLASGIGHMYEGVKHGLENGFTKEVWSEIGKGALEFTKGALQLAGTVMAVVSGAGIGMIIAGSLLQNAGSIIDAVASGNPAAIAGALAGVALSVVLSKFGNVLAQKLMSKVAPVSTEIIEQGLTKVGEGLGARGAAEIIAERGAAKVTQMSVEAGTRAAEVGAANLEKVVAPALTAAREAFGVGSQQAAQAVKDAAIKVADEAVAPQVNALMAKLGVTDKVAKLVSTEVLEQASNAGILGQMGFGGGKVLSWMGFGNTALRNSIAKAAPEMGEEAVALLAKNLSRAVQQGGYETLMKEALTNGITQGMRAGLLETVEKPMLGAFKNGMAGAVKQFVEKHGLTELEERSMTEGLEIGFNKAYGRVLREHVHAGVERAFDRKSGGKAFVPPLEKKKVNELLEAHSTEFTKPVSLEVKQLAYEELAKKNDDYIPKPIVVAEHEASADGSVYLVTKTLKWNPSQNAYVLDKQNRTLEGSLAHAIEKYLVDDHRAVEARKQVVLKTEEQQEFVKAVMLGRRQEALSLAA